MKNITAEMVDDPIETFREQGNKIPVVTISDHPRFVKGTRLDWGFVQVAIEDGWAVTIFPHKVNRSNCKHPQGFDRTGLQLGSNGKDYRLYWCPICHAERGVIIENEKDVVDHYPTDHAWDHSEDIL